MGTILLGGRVITAGDRGVLERGVVVVERGRIVAVGEEGEVPLFGAAHEIIDVKGRTIIPGLIDSHVHISPFVDEETANGVDEGSVTSAVLRAVGNLRHAVSMGVTTVRDLGCKHSGIFTLRQAVDSGRIPGPRILPAGAAIAMTGGHGYNVVANEADGPDAVRAMARAQLKRGAAVVKVMAGGGAGTPGEEALDSQLTVAEMAAAAEEAHKKGRACASHAGGIDAILGSLEAGIDTIEHGFVMDDACIRKMVETGAYYVPTLELYERVVRLGTKVYPPFMVAKAEEIVGPHKETFQMAVKGGVKIAAGTDAGVRWLTGEIAVELARMVDFGLSPMATIIAATRNAADALRVLDRLGTLDVGKIADIVVVDGNPLDDMSALRNVWMVMKEGELSTDGRR